MWNEIGVWDLTAKDKGKVLEMGCFCCRVMVRLRDRGKGKVLERGCFCCSVMVRLRKTTN
jgi:hypothetical protein